MKEKKVPDFGDIVSLSSQVYSPAFYSLLLLLCTGTFLTSGTLLRDAASKVEQSVVGKIGNTSQFTRVAFFLVCFLSAPQVFGMLRGLSPLNLSFYGHGLYNFSTGDERVAEIWCAFPVLGDLDEVESFIISIAAREQGFSDIWDLAFSDNMQRHLNLFNIAFTVLTTIFISGVLSTFFRNYRTLAPTKAIILILVSASILIESYSSLINGIAIQGQQTIITAHTTLVREGHMQAIDKACISEKKKFLEAYEQPIPDITLDLNWPRISSIIPFQDTD